MEETKTAEYENVKQGVSVTLTPPRGILFNEYEWNEDEIKDLKLTFRSIIETIRTRFMVSKEEENKTDRFTGLPPTCTIYLGDNHPGL